MSDPQLTVEVTGPVATVTISNPARRNAMTHEMWRRLPVLLDRVEADPAVRALVLTGAGDTFCAGADLADLGETLALGDAGVAVAAEERLAAFAKPTIAAVRGACVGGGCQLAVACDLRIVAADARFGVPPARLGLVYPAPTTRRLAALVGPATAKYLLFTGELIDAERAVRVGLADEVVPVDRLADRVAGLTGSVAARSQLTVVAAKEIVDGRADADRVAWWYGQVQTSGEAREGVAAFHERRPARFTWAVPPEKTSGPDVGAGPAGSWGD
ncbi:enoyl-CoA hydratase/isomerase family protein [Micromonospora sp. WMMD882]|uniref:enoyl-CoA hydratase/isomerase family protein n=1 Tax=Micromonospora sp. WMMD882 TaxID=3015151 RepID=UPI00248CE7C4|nr:enoyl-CoA hydratase/isomerase family protein [Micromonospora sp. WMMD882]WBB78925.1 enoyl-CoA hydratase/isomerase family protein [Micromonospora sp. WMMD882]